MVLFVVAFINRETEFCKDFVIKINHHRQSEFITNIEVDEIINAKGNLKGQRIKQINISILESAIKKNAWVKNAELYFENNGILHVDIEQKEPIARLFTVNGLSYYLNNLGERLPVKQNATSRVLVITNFPSDNLKLSTTDSILLNETTRLANFINVDSFWNAQIAQINITNTGKFEFTPTIGNQLIVFGDSSNLKEKFDKLYSYYKSVWLQNGLNTYDTLDIRFEHQIVAKMKNKIIVQNDTLSNSLLIVDSLKQKP